MLTPEVITFESLSRILIVIFDAGSAASHVTDPDDGTSQRGPKNVVPLS